MIPIAKPIIGDEEKRAVLEVLDSGMLAQGKKVAEFEREFAKFIGVKHGIATSNGTTALHTALLAYNIGPGDEVITTPFSFIATANAIKMTGATPIFVDIEEKTFNINPDLIEKAITPKTKAILPVHLFGLSADMDKIELIAKKYNLKIIEDACQAHGATINHKKVGSFGTGCFSFYPTKNITTGEGGMITTDDDSVAEKARKIINHGSQKKYFHDVMGYNYRMTDIAGAIGIEQLKKINLFNSRRKQNAEYLTQHLRFLSGIITPTLTEGHVFHQYTIRVTHNYPKTREELSELLKREGIDNAIFYPLSIHQQKVYEERADKKLPVTEKIAKEVLSLPIHPSVTEEELNKIIEVFKKIT